MRDEEEQEENEKERVGITSRRCEFKLGGRGRRKH